MSGLVRASGQGTPHPVSEVLQRILQLELRLVSKTALRRQRQGKRLGRVSSRLNSWPDHREPGARVSVPSKTPSWNAGGQFNILEADAVSPAQLLLLKDEALGEVQSAVAKDAYRARRFVGSSRPHLRCKFRCRSSGYWRVLGMIASFESRSRYPCDPREGEFAIKGEIASSIIVGKNCW